MTKFRLVAAALVFSLIGLPLLPVRAQELTRSNVIQIAPQLAAVLGQLNTTLTVRQNQFARQNSALAGMAGTIGGIGIAVADIDNQNLSTTDRTLFNQQVDLLAVQFSTLGTYVDRIARDRTNFNSALDTIVNIIGSISESIADVV